MNYKFLKFLKLLQPYITFLYLVVCFLGLIVLPSFAEFDNSDARYFYIDCIENNNNIYLENMGIREEMMTQMVLRPRDIELGTAIPPFVALSLPGDMKTRVRFGFLNRNGNKIPNQFVQIGPLNNRLYVSFPCPDGGFCLSVTDEANGTITSKYATAKTSFPGCP